MRALLCLQQLEIIRKSRLTQTPFPAEFHVQKSQQILPKGNLVLLYNIAPFPIDLGQILLRAAKE